MNDIYNYTKVKLAFNGIEVEQDVYVQCIFPDDSLDPYEEGFGFFIQLLNKEFNQIEVPIQFSYILYKDIIPKRGKYKWILERRDPDIKVQDMPDMIWSSINYFDPPHKRRWFKIRKGGLIDDEDIEIKLSEVEHLPLYWENTRSQFHFIVVAMLFRSVFYDQFDKMNLEELKKSLVEQLMLNPRYGLEEREYSTLVEDLIRDVYQLWD